MVSDPVRELQKWLTMPSDTHHTQDLSTVLETLESLAVGRQVRVRRLTIAMPIGTDTLRFGAQLTRRLRARGMDDIEVHVVEDGLHDARVVAVEYARD
jgi:hypothetical protein